jgi:hypothetical protein
VPRRSFPGRSLLRGLFLGGGYVVLVSLIVSQTSETSFTLTLAAVLTTITMLFVLALLLAVRWSMGEERRRFQVQLGSLFVLTAVFASYFAIVRWFAHIGSTPIGRLNIGAWVAIFIYSGVLLLISVPFVLLLGDGLLALAAWLVWRPSVQRVLRRMRRKARKQ